MKIRTRITILFTVITSSILIVFASIVYLSAKENRENEFYELLKKEAITKAALFFEAKVDEEVLQNIYRSNREFIREVEVAIYEPDFTLLYHDAVDIDIVKETPEMIDSVIAKTTIYFYQDHWQVIGTKYYYNNQLYIITAAAYDEYGYTKLNNLLKTIAISLVFAIIIVIIAGYFFSKKALYPVKNMALKAKQISATNLDLRLDTGNETDELGELAQTFNEMLNRLEKSFDAQKHFVSNISHELRTPLAAIISELELAIDKKRTVEDYKTAIRSALNDSKKLVKLSNSLLDLAKASYDPTEISFKPTRIDEVILESKLFVQKNNAAFSINIDFEQEIDDESKITVLGNEYLLTVACNNLLENGCKFSLNSKVSVALLHKNNHVIIKITDYGIGIDKEELPHIFTPFYRGKNKEFSSGNGIGLFLTKKIIELHNGSISVSSKIEKGSIFTVQLPVCS